jgi:ATP/maltotriose-dependent transcriptional regulator MalT
MGRFTEAIEVARAGAAAHAGLPPWLARRGMAAHVINEAHALGYSGRFDQARTIVEGALASARSVRAHAAVVWFEVVLGEIERDSGHATLAVEHFTAASELASTAGQQAALVWAWVGVAQGHLLLGDAEAASAALDRADESESPLATSWSTRERTRAWLMACRGDLAGARRLIAEIAGEIRRDRLHNFEGGLIHDLVRFGDPSAAVDRLSELAELMDGPYIDALALHARAAATGDPAAYDGAVDMFEAMECLVLGAEAAIEAAELHRSAGDQRAATALAQRAQRMLTRAGGARTPGLLRGSGVEPLSGREREVALMAADGLASKEIAARLVVSKRTVDSHLDRIYRKLGISSRAQLSAALLDDTTGRG